MCQINNTTSGEIELPKTPDTENIIIFHWIFIWYIQRLPTYIKPLLRGCCFNWWRRRDSNSGHCGYEPHALANWATPPYYIFWSWWPGLNRWPYPYQGYALPTELHQQNRFWLRGEDLNLWPSGYEPDELPTAPPRDLVKNMELARGIEPPTCWLQVSCSANWATPAFLAFVCQHRADR